MEAYPLKSLAKAVQYLIEEFCEVNDIVIPLHAVAVKHRSDTMSRPNDGKGASDCYTDSSA